MNFEIISTNHAPAAVGPYSQAVRCNDMLYCSGQIPLDPKTNQIVAGDTGAQTKQVMENLKAVLAAAGIGFENVVMTTIYLTDLGDFMVVNKIYEEYFEKNHYPARVTVEVSKLPKDARVEISMIAKLPS
ncbi:MAG: RidA family protein [bacterium]|nr:RidA family protein [bacterium]